MGAFYIDSVEVTSNVNTFTVQLLVADILDVNKQTNQDNQDFIWNQSIAVINNLYNKLNRGQLFEDLVQEIEPITLTPFTDRLDKGLAGMETTLTISVKNDMTLCVFPFKYAANGVTVVLKSGYAAGTTGKVQGDNSGKIYTAVNETQLRAMDVDTDDFTSVCTTLVTNMNSLFENATTFNQDINTWDVSNVTTMFQMFFDAESFNKPVNSWDVGNVTNFGQMFRSAKLFNKPLNNWNVANVTTMISMFQDALSFNQPLDNWDVSSVNSIRNMFVGASSFNQPLNSWDVSSVTNMVGVFVDASSFNQDINNWDVSSVTSIRNMFLDSNSFNQPLNSWDVSSVTNMVGVFADATSFNQPLDNWDVSSVTNMGLMFAIAESFNQDISNWCVTNIASEPNNFDTGADAWVLANSRPIWGTCP